MKSIKTKLITLTLSITLGISLLLATISFLAINIIVERNFDAFSVPLAKQASTTVSTYLKDNMNVITKISRSPNLVYAKDTQEEIKYIESEIKILSYADYSYFNVDGSLINSSNNNPYNYSSSSVFELAINDVRNIVSDPFSSDQNILYTVYSPVINKNKTIQKVLVISFYYNDLNNLVNNIKFGKNGTAYLINNEGAIITDPYISNLSNLVNPIEKVKEDKNNKEVKAIADVHKTVLNKKEGNIKFDYGKINKLASFAYVPEIDGYIIMTSPVTDYVNITKISLIFICIIAILFMLAFLLVHRISKKIALPIISASERLKSLSEGNLSDPVNIAKTKDELYVLTNSLQETIIAFKSYITKITDALVKIADGDLTDRVHGAFHGDFIKIKSTFNSILESLIDTFGNISAASEQVNSGANQVSNGAQALSHGATEQASAIQELSATITDVSHQITQNAKSAKDAESIVEDTTDSILSCNDDMNEMLNAMQEINLSSNEISKIIKVIDDIAFQTNILALNAAVEAARAGSAGKGFAVVADEVRSLAAKSAEAAKQTTALIEGSVQTVDHGSKIATKTANALSEIVDKAKGINTLVKDISKASEYQAQSIEQINSGVDQISAVVQTNTATAEQSAAASEELSGQSLLLSNMISKFRIGDKEKIFGAKSTQFGASNNHIVSEFSFDDEDEPAPQFNFSDSNDDEPAPQFNFSDSDDDEPAPQFNFSDSNDDEPVSQFNFSDSDDDEPAPQFNFSESNDDEPVSQFNFSDSDDDEPVSQFDFSNQDLKIDLDDEDDKY